jgi:beta-lactamase class A
MKRWIIAIFALFFGFASANATTTLKNLEASFDGKIGIYAINTGNQEIIARRANEPFPMQSTMKFIGVAALLKATDSHTLQETIYYQPEDLIFWHPITGKYLKQGMTLEALAEAAMTYSDNTATNLIIKKLGGLQAVTQFARTIGNKSFQLSHYEAELNSDPTHTDDTATPKDMAESLQKILLGDVLSRASREKLKLWMQNNTTSYQRMRAGTPVGWIVLDKTGSGDYGISNDIGILWSPFCKPIILAIYTVQNKPNAKGRDDIVATVTTMVLEQFAKMDACFKAM